MKRDEHEFVVLSCRYFYLFHDSHKHYNDSWDSREWKWIEKHKVLLVEKFKINSWARSVFSSCWGNLRVKTRIWCRCHLTIDSKMEKNEISDTLNIIEFFCALNNNKKCFSIISKNNEKKWNKNLRWIEVTSRKETHSLILWIEYNHKINTKFSKRIPLWKKKHID
jgi:hypothetical protein